MFKEYKDERINELIKKSFELAVRDDEWKLRYLQEWNILFEDIDKMLEYVENGYKGELRVNSNMWWVLQETLFKVLELYNLELIGEEKVSENELVVPKNKLEEDNYYYSVFVLGRDLLKGILPYEDDLAYEFCKKVAVDFEESDYNVNTKGLYECLEEYVRDNFYLKNGEITWKGEKIQ